MAERWVNVDASHVGLPSFRVSSPLCRVGSPLSDRSGRASPVPHGPGTAAVIAIHRLQDKQDAVQKKTFTKWVNSFLIKHVPPMQMVDLFEDIKDGVMLLSLLEVLSGETLPIERHRQMKRPHYLSNVSVALQFLESRRIKLVNIFPAEIVDGKPSIVLGLIWTIILYFQIEEHTRQIPRQALSPPLSSSASTVSNSSQESTSVTPAKRANPAPLQQLRGNAKKVMLSWAQKAVTKKFGVEVRDFGTSWRDGVAFNALIHGLRPELVDMSTLSQNTSRINLENAFNTAEQYLGIPRLLDVEDVDMDKPDERSIMTYVAKFLEKFPDPDLDFPDVARAEDEKRAENGEVDEFDDLLKWLDKADDMLKIVDKPVHNREQEYSQYLQFTEDLRLKFSTYDRLRVRFHSHQSTESSSSSSSSRPTTSVLTAEKLTFLEQRWSYTNARTRVWLWKLDNSLPGRVGQIGDWLYRAEEDLKAMEKSSEEKVLDKTLRDIRDHLDRLATLTKELPEYRSDFQRFKQLGICEGQVLPHSQMSNIEERLNKVSVHLDHLRKQFAFDELKYQLLIQLDSAETKLKVWSAKFGSDENVGHLLADHKEFVVSRRFAESMDRMILDCKQKAAAYKQLHHTDRKLVNSVNKSLEKIAEDWHRLHIELQSMRSLLEKTLEHWRHYKSCKDVLETWLHEAEQVISAKDNTRPGFFDDLDQWEAKKKKVPTASKFLIEVCDDDVAAEVKEQVFQIDTRWQNIRAAITGQSVIDYDISLQKMYQWCEMVEAGLKSEVAAGFEQMADRLKWLENVDKESDIQEAEFKKTHTIAQTLAKTCDRAATENRLGQLRDIKGRLVKVRENVVKQVKLLHELLPQAESLKNGHAELCGWLEQGEELLFSHQIDGDIVAVEERLDEHRVYFDRTNYYRTMLDKQKTTYKTFLRAADKHFNTTVLDSDMERLTERFQECVDSSKEWEKRLEHSLQMWRRLQETAKPLEDWVSIAKAVSADAVEMNENSSTSIMCALDSGIDLRHQVEEFERAGVGLLTAVVEKDRPELEQSLNYLVKHYQELLVSLASRLFGHHESTFVHDIAAGESVLKCHADAMQQQPDVAGLLAEHKATFDEPSLAVACDEHLSSMSDIAKKIAPLSSRVNQSDGSPSLLSSYEVHRRRCDAVMKEAEKQKSVLEYWLRRDEFVAWMDGLELTIQQLKEESVSTPEYRQTLENFQAVVQNIDSHRGDAKWLQRTVEALFPANSAQHEAENQLLTELINRYQQLLPAVEITTSRSSVVVRCHDYKESVERQMQWLTATEEKVREDLPVDDLDSVRVLLEEQQGILATLENQQTKLESEIETGRKLIQSGDVPEFVSDAVSALTDSVNETSQLANMKLQSLKELLGKKKKVPTATLR